MSGRRRGSGVSVGHDAFLDIVANLVGILIILVVILGAKSQAIMSEVKPRMAVAYHFFKDFDTAPGVYERIRSTYDGPLSLAEDYMVWNVTKDDITVRLAEVDHHTWSPPLAAAAEPPKEEDKVAFAKKVGVETLDFSEFTNAGRWDVDDVLRPIYEEASEVIGKEFKYPGDE